MLKFINKTWDDTRHKENWWLGFIVTVMVILGTAVGVLYMLLDYTAQHK